MPPLSYDDPGASRSAGPSPASINFGCRMNRTLAKTFLALALTAGAAALSGCATQTDLDLYLQGQLAKEKGQMPQAMASLNKAIEKNPKMGAAYLARGDIYQSEN